MRTYITILRPLKGRYILFARRLAWQKEEEPIGKKSNLPVAHTVLMNTARSFLSSSLHKCLPFFYTNCHALRYVCVPFFCPSLILRSLSIPLLSFALIRGFTFPDFFASWTLLFPRTLLSYKSSGFLYCYSKQTSAAILCYLDKCMETKTNCGLFGWNHNHDAAERHQKNRL